MIRYYLWQRTLTLLWAGFSLLASSCSPQLTPPDSRPMFYLVLCAPWRQNSVDLITGAALFWFLVGFSQWKALIRSEVQEQEERGQVHIPQLQLLNGLHLWAMAALYNQHSWEGVPVFPTLLHHCHLPWPFTSITSGGLTTSPSFQPLGASCSLLVLFP